MRDRPSVSNSPLKEEVEIAIIGLAGDEMDEEGTEEWTNKVDRGGLWHVNDDVYSLFLSMEFEALSDKPHSTLSSRARRYNYCNKVGQTWYTIKLNQLTSL